MKLLCSNSLEKEEKQKLFSFHFRIIQYFISHKVRKCYTEVCGRSVNSYRRHYNYPLKVSGIFCVLLIDLTAD